MTIELWAKPDVDPHAWLVNKHSNPDDGSWFFRLGVNHTLSLESFPFPAGVGTFESNTPILAGSWVHLAVTFNDTTDEYRFYVNGDPDGTGTAEIDIIDNTRDLYIGAEEGRPSNFFEGILDDVRIWNVVRSQGEIAAAMGTTLAGSEPGLVAYWPFDEGAGQSIQDATANANHGQLGETSGTDSSDPSWVAVEAIPTASEWGLVVMTLLGLTIGTIILARLRPIHA